MGALATEPRWTSAKDALAPVRSGQHVLVASGAAAPQRLVAALAERGRALDDLEVLHLMTLGPAPYAAPEYAGHVRHNALFIGANTRPAVGAGLADYTPCFLHQVPALMRSGHLPVDAALLQVSPPRDGFCSLGVSVDVVRAAIDAASYVAAQVNPRMPWTEGDSRIPLDDVDAFVDGDEPLLEAPPRPTTAVALWIGRYVSELVEDGSTLQVGIGAIPDAVLASLAGRKNLGVHSEMISDGVLDLVQGGAINGRAKTLHPGKVVTSFCLGSRRLYEAMDRNPGFLFMPSDYVNDPAVIARNDKMVAINSALQTDLTGQVAADSVDGRLYSGVGGQVDFVRGAAASRAGKAIIAMPSTARDGTVSRIVCCLGPGSGVVTTRADVDYVVTEYGIASLKGKTIRERALALIQIAHPRFRKALAAEASKVGFLDAGHVLPEALEPSPPEWRARRRFGDLDVLFRPLAPADERGLKDLFYSQSAETTTQRFGIPLKRLPEAQFQELVAIDFRSSVAIGAFISHRGRRRLVAVGRYHRGPTETTAELAVTVHDDFQGRGIGSFLVDHLAGIAAGRGIASFWCETASVPMLRVLRRRFEDVRERGAFEDGVRAGVRLADWKGRPKP